MSAPRTNIEKQHRRHKGPIVGIVLAVIVVVIAFIFFLGGETSPTTAPATPAPDPTATTP